LGNIYRADKQLKKALAEYNRAEKLGLAQNDGILPRELLPLHYSRAIVYDLLDMWDKAEADLLIAMDKIPNNPIVLNYLGYAYADRGMELEKAKSMIGQALMAAPNDAYIVDSMGWILYRMGMYEQALKYLERAASMRPYHMVINDHLGDVYWKLGRKREAHYMWQRAVDYFDATDEEQARMINETKRKLREGLNNT
jgi:tetratricopeptide (TPR) repeat protein